MNDRARRLVTLLEQSGTWITAASLATSLGCSARTVKTTVAHLNESHPGIVITSIRRSPSPPPAPRPSTPRASWAPMPSSPTRTCARSSSTRRATATSSIRRACRGSMPPWWATPSATITSTSCGRICAATMSS
ncbi:HTH domain-containing protein [Collinsella intestinalis]|uniref:HTH domain-containing protein n=1 Tax=Collinsella intestinalis TaxID=147207 RepID=UPI00338E701B